MSKRSYTHGETSLLNLLETRRQANEAALAQIDALEAHARMLLDAHQILLPDHFD